MPRYKLLTTISDVVLALAPSPATPDPAAPGAKLDVEVAFAGYTADGEFNFDIPAYDPATFNLLNAIHVGLYEKPADGTAPVIPDDPALVVSGDNHFVTDTSQIREAKQVIVDATDAPEGQYVALAVLEFAD